jgi:hypothetical protein
MPAFEVEHLSNERLQDAWPVLCLSGAEVLEQWWESEALDLIERGGGVLVARTADGSVHGIATYECVNRPRAGRTLVVDRLVTFELSRKAPAKRALCEVLSRIARVFCCSKIAWLLPASADGPLLARRIVSPRSDGSDACASPSR